MSSQSPPPETRSWIARAFVAVEDVVYIGLGLLLAGGALALLVTGFTYLVQGSMDEKELPGRITHLLSRALLILLIVELLYTVQVSFREHTLVPEPFLLVALISAIRRVLLLTAEFGDVSKMPEDAFQHFIVELAVLTVLIVALTVSLLLLRKRGAPVVAQRT